MKNSVQEEFIEKCVEEYNDASSMREAAKNLGISVMKLRKILITAGAYSTVLSKEIAALYNEGEEIESICKIECMSRACVYSYLPYQNIVYNLPEKSREAKKQKRYRERMRSNQGVQGGQGIQGSHTVSYQTNAQTGRQDSVQSDAHRGQQGAVQSDAHRGSTASQNMPQIVDDELLAWLNAHPGIVADLKKRSKTVRGKFVNIHVTNIEEAKAMCDKYNVKWKIVKNRIKEQMTDDELGAEPKVDFKAKTCYSGAYDFITEVDSELDRVGAKDLHDHVDILLNEDGELLFVCSPYYTGHTGYAGHIGDLKLNSFTIEDSEHYPYMGVRAIVIRRK